MRNLITAQEVIDLAFAENSNMMADSIPGTAIRIAEIKYIRPAFGVMYPLLADKYADYTNDYVKPALAYFVKCEMVSSIAIDMSNSGVAIANPQYQSAATDKQRQRLYDSVMSNAKTLLDFALSYIAENIELFPDFNGEAPKKHHRIGGLLLGNGSPSKGQSASIAGETFKAELDKKQDRVPGKGLSTNDFTDEYKKKVDEFSGTPITIDTELSETSGNAIANSAVTNALLDKVDAEEVSSTEATVEFPQVMYTAQSLNESQQEQARNNIYAMANTPSGDPMHLWFEKLGASYNETSGYWEMLG